MLRGPFWPIPSSCAQSSDCGGLPLSVYGAAAAGARQQPSPRIHETNDRPPINLEGAGDLISQGDFPSRQAYDLRMALPRRTGARIQGGGLSLTTPGGIGKRQTVLIVDDEPKLRVLVQTTIESPEYQVIEACDGEEAWTLIKERKPALVLLDIKMPRRSGIEVLKAIRADPELRGTQVMMLTSSDDQADIDAGILAGADFYLTKPFLPADLVVRVSEAIGHRAPSW